jgi:hypothetical protein
MRRYSSFIAAVLVLGCSDAPSKSTGPQLSGAVVRGAPAGANAEGNIRSDHGNNGGHRVAVTLLTGDEEVPPRATNATGELSLRLGKDGASIDYTLEVNDIRNITQAHIHREAKGANGGIVVWLYPSVKSTSALPAGGGPVTRLVVEGTFTAADLRGSLANQPLSAFLELVEAHLLYGNVHTDDGVAPGNTGPGDFPGGEVRGQLDKHNH